MRASLFFLSAITAAAVGVACSDRAVPTEERAGPSFGVRGDSAGGNSTYRVRSNGNRADVSWSGDSLGGGWMYGSLSAATTDSLATRMTTVSWSIQACDINYYCTYSYGYGSVPTSVFTANGDRRARLAFNPRDYPGQLYIYGDTLGPVDVSWVQTGAYLYSFSGTSEWQYPGYRYRQRGGYENSSASATGNVGAWVLPASASAYLGTNRNMEVTFYR